MTIQYTKLHADVPTPQRAHPTDAGVDLVADCVMHDKERYTEWDTDIIQPGNSRLYGTGVKTAIPAGHVGLLFARSSVGVKRRLDIANGTGVIDADYRGEIMVSLRNTGTHAARVDRGERIVQMVIVPVILNPWEEVDELGETVRGDGGFGSTGH